MRDVFSRFVPEDVVDQVLARTDSDLRLGGVSLESTVMFTDLRGFTTFSEALPPARVIECLNVYLSEMTEAIQEHGGTLVSYEGDGIMAVFGAPIEQPDHADRAVAASREMLTERLPKWNRWLREQEVSDGFKMGIGLNTGMVVSGNVGSERRLEYTAIGDTTNTASRLQGMTKGQSHLLFFADTTKERLQQEPDDLVFIDEFEVRGRAAAGEDLVDRGRQRRGVRGAEGRRLRFGGQVAAAGADVDRLVLAEVADLDDAALHDRQRSVALILDEPLRPAHGRRAVPALGREAPLPVAPEPANRLAGLRVRAHGAQPARAARPEVPSLEHRAP